MHLASRAPNNEGLGFILLQSGINIEALCAALLEALAHSSSQIPLSCPVAPLKRQMPLSCPVAPPSQRKLHKDGGGGGVARRARAARAPKAKSCATSSKTSSKTPCAASLRCWRRRRRRRRRRRWWWWCAGGGSNVPSSSRTGGRTYTHPGVDEEGPREPVRRHWKMMMGKINTFALPSCAAS